MRHALGLAIVLATLAPTTVRAQDTTSFVVMLGTDTLSLEQYVRTPNRLRGEYVTRAPRALHRLYTAELSPDGTMRNFEMITRRLADGPGPAETRATIEFRADSAITTAPRGDSTVTTRMAAGPGGLPFVLGVMGIIEQIGRQARAAGATLMVPYIGPGAPQPNRATVSRRGGDTLEMWVDTQTARLGPWRFRLDPAGRLVGFSGVGTPFQGEAQRVKSLDLAATRAAYAGRPLGALSTRDTARAQLGGAELWVDYGRPSQRGREIFGAVVPWNEVWRTGANAATQLHTPVDLVIGGAAVPAGTYSVWTLPAPGGWKLIINGQAGQWGTEYHAERDLARVDLATETLPAPVERFTIEIEPRDDGAVLKMSWDRTRASVPIKKKV